MEGDSSGDSASVLDATRKLGLPVISSVSMLREGIGLAADSENDSSFLSASTKNPIVEMGPEMTGSDWSASTNPSGIPPGSGQASYYQTLEEVSSDENLSHVRVSIGEYISDISTDEEGVNQQEMIMEDTRLLLEIGKHDFDFNCDNSNKHATEQIANAVAKLGAHCESRESDSYPDGPASLDSWGIHRSLRLRGGAGAAAETNSNGGGWGNSGGSGGSTAVGNPPAWNQPPPSAGPPGQAQSGNPGSSWGQQPNDTSYGENSVNSSGSAGGSGIAAPGNGSSTSWAQAAGKGLPNSAQGNPNSPGSSTNSNPGGSSSSVNAPGLGNANAVGGSGGSGAAANSASAPNGSGASVTSGTGDSQQQKRELEKIREALYATDGWGGNNVNQDSEWIVPPSPPRSPGSENPSTWKPSHNSTGTELWETNIRNGGVGPNRVPEMPSSSVKPPWGRYGNANEFGGQWDPEDDTGDVGQSWNTPPPNQWGSGMSGAPGAGSGMWQQNKDKAGVDWANPGAANSGQSWDPRGSSTNRWGNAPGGPIGGIGKPSGGPGVQVGSSWGAKSGWGDENAAPGKGGDDGMRKKDSMMARGMSGGPGMRMPPGARPPGHRGWGDEGSSVPDASGTSGWGMPPSSPPNAGGWGQKPKPTGIGWGDPNDMMDSSAGGWAGHKQRLGPGPSNGWAGGQQSTGGWPLDGSAPVQESGNWSTSGSWASDVQRRQMMSKQQVKPMFKDVWKQQFYKDESGVMGGGRNMDEMQDMGHGYGSHHRNDSVGMDPSGVGMGMQTGGAGPGGWSSSLSGAVRMDDHHHGHHGAGGSFGGGSPYDMGVGNQMMHGGPGVGMGRGPGSGFMGQMQQNVPQFMQGRGSSGPGGIGAGVPGGGGLGAASSVGGGVRQGQPSSQQLHLLVHQIHAAVTAGHLNPQILNQKLSPPTLVLLHELLNQIKVLQSLTQQQQSYQQGHMRGVPPNALMQVSVKITQTKQQIQNLQNQINAQQGLFPKPGGPHHGGPGGMMMDSNAPGGGSGGFQKFGQGPGTPGFGGAIGHEAGFSSLMGSMSLNAPGGGGPGGGGGGMGSVANPGDMSGGGPMDHQQHSSGMPPSASRFFSDWRLGDANKRDDGHSGLGYDGTWSTPNAKVDSGWPDSSQMSGSSSSAGGQQSQVGMATSQAGGGWSTGVGVGGGGAAHNYNISDLPEFEPGKPWKGNQLLKNIEDDPTITPGSVKRSPLSVAAIKEPDLGMKSTQPGTSATSTVSDSSSTVAGAKSGNGGSSVSGGSANGASNAQSITTSTSGGPGFGTSTWSYSSGRSSHTWLVLNNLSPGMDGSTLKTLCMQHGPLNAFHLMAQQGMALVRYSSYDEAVKAQASLHNCVLGSASIRADFASDGEVQSFLGNAQQQGQVAASTPSSVQSQMMQQQAAAAAWSNASLTSQASAMSKSHEAAWAQPGMNSWSGGNPSSLWDSAEQSHSYLPDNLI